MELSCTHLQTGIRDKSSIFSLCIKISKMRLTQKQLTHTGELRHWFSWRKRPLKCWNYVLIFFLSFGLMPLGNCVLLLLNWTVRVSRCLWPAFFRILHQEHHKVLLHHMLRCFIWSQAHSTKNTTKVLTAQTPNPKVLVWKSCILYASYPTLWYL